jgi:hypothetical protein
MQRIDGVQSARVRLNEGMTIVELKTGNTVTLAKLRQVIKDNGFVSKEALVIARGSVIGGPGAPVFEVGGTREHLVPSGPAEQRGDAWQLSVAPTPK